MPASPIAEGIVAAHEQQADALVLDQVLNFGQDIRVGGPQSCSGDIAQDDDIVGVLVELEQVDLGRRRFLVPQPDRVHADAAVGRQSVAEELRLGETRPID